MTPSGIEPATFRFVGQYLNNCATISGPPTEHCTYIKTWNSVSLPLCLSFLLLWTNGKTSTAVAHGIEGKASFQAFEAVVDKGLGFFGVSASYRNPKYQQKEALSFKAVHDSKTWYTSLHLTSLRPFATDYTRIHEYNVDCFYKTPCSYWAEWQDTSWLESTTVWNLSVSISHPHPL
jgi:hypothetical protein